MCVCVCVCDSPDCLCVYRREIVDNHVKENALNIVTEERTYHIYAESPEDARWVSMATPSSLAISFSIITLRIVIEG